MDRYVKLNSFEEGREDMVSCSLGWPGTHSVPEGDLEQISQSSAGIKGVSYQA